MAERPSIDVPKQRRTEGSRPGGRSARIVRDVLDAAYAELQRVGYGALRIDDVAARSGVNKTTIYRRWPTKAELVRAACLGVEEPEVRESGAIRHDLVEAVMDALARFATPERLGMIRMLQTERGDPDLASIGRALRLRHRSRRVALVERAVARGELPRGIDAELVVETILSTVYARVLRYDEPVDRRFVETLVDLVLAGAKATAR